LAKNKLEALSIREVRISCLIAASSEQLVWYS